MAEDLLTLQKMQVISWSCLAVLTVGAAVIVSFEFAWAVLVGGLISIGSFWVSSSEVMRVIHSVVSLSTLEDRQAQARQGHKGYLVKFWGRLAIIGVVLLVIIKSQVVNIFGLILGLSTVVLAITFISLNVARHYFFRGRR
ncbi:MAG: ATP synthase subunit I [Proteobacteria bacterium]|nr:ATP synthase subunit I [Pseudomonadota bacterium]